MSPWKDAARRAGRAPAEPFVRYFNRRFEDVHGHLDNEMAVMSARLEETLATTRALQERIATDVEVMSELTVGLERIADRLAGEVDRVLAAVERVREDIERLQPKA